jgi:hypothetical protein
VLVVRGGIRDHNRRRYSNQEGKKIWRKNYSGAKKELGHNYQGVERGREIIHRGKSMHQSHFNIS